MNSRFSMLPGGGLWTRYKWWRFRRAIDEFARSMNELGEALTAATAALQDFGRAWEKRQDASTNAR